MFFNRKKGTELPIGYYQSDDGHEVRASLVSETSLSAPEKTGWMIVCYLISGECFELTTAQSVEEAREILAQQRITFVSEHKLTD